MKGKLFEFPADKPGTKWIVGLGVAGMVLILLSELWPQKLAATAEQAAPAQPAASDSYEQQMEQRLAQLIAQLDGAGSTQVMVTLSSEEEAVYALDTQQKGEDDLSETHVILGDGTALRETTLTPAVSGVAVVCEGGGDVRVVARITEMLSALLDLPTNRISVQKMK